MCTVIQDVSAFSPNTKTFVTRKQHDNFILAATGQVPSLSPFENFPLYGTHVYLCGFRAASSQHVVVHIMHIRECILVPAQEYIHTLTHVCKLVGQYCNHRCRFQTGTYLTTYNVHAHAHSPPPGLTMVSQLCPEVSA